MMGPAVMIGAAATRILLETLQNMASPTGLFTVFAEVKNIWEFSETPIPWKTVPDTLLSPTDAALAAVTEIPVPLLAVMMLSVISALELFSTKICEKLPLVLCKTLRKIPP